MNHAKPAEAATNALNSTQSREKDLLGRRLGACPSSAVNTSDSRAYGNANTNSYSHAMRPTSMAHHHIIGTTCSILALCAGMASAAAITSGPTQAVSSAVLDSGITSIDAAGEVLVFGNGRRLHIAELGIDSPRVIAQTDPLSHDITRLALGSGFVVAEIGRNGYSLFRLDKTGAPSPALPISLADCNNFRVVDSRMYCPGFTSLHMADLGTPSQGISTTTYKDSDFNIKTDIAVAGSLGYLTSAPSTPQRTGGLRVVDLSDPHDLRTLGSIELPAQAQAVDYHNGFAYVYSVRRWAEPYYQIISVIDVKDPTRPQLISSIDLGGLDDAGWLAPVWQCQGNRERRRNLIYHDGYLYAGGGSQGVFIIDVREPALPNMVKYFSTVCDSQLAFVGDRLLSVGGVNRGGWIDAQTGIQVVEVAQPNEAQVLGWWAFETAGRAQLVMRRGDQLQVLMESELQTWDIASPLQPRVVAREPIPPLQQNADPGTLPYLGQLHASRGLLFVPDGDHGVHVLDVRNPAAPRFVKTLPTAGRVGKKVAVWRDWLVVPVNRRLETLDLSNGGKQATVIDLGHSARDVALVGDEAYAVGWDCPRSCEGWLSAVRLSITGGRVVSASVVSKLSLGEDRPLLVAGHEGFLYVPVVNSGQLGNFHLVVDVGDPISPKVLHRDRDLVQPVSIDVAGERIGLRWAGEQLQYLIRCPYGGPGCAGYFDVGQPDRPTEVQYAGLRLGARDRDVQDGLIFQVDEGGKVEIALVANEGAQLGPLPTPYPTAQLPRFIFMTPTPQVTVNPTSRATMVRPRIPWMATTLVFLPQVTR